jgi:hypothetical protein
MPYETLITKRVTSMEIYGDGTNMHGFRFGHPDGTKTTTPRVSGVPNTTPANVFTITGNFIGLDVAFNTFPRDNVLYT